MRVCLAEKDNVDQEKIKTLPTSQTLGSWPSIFCEKDENKKSG
jgi:hypothetical protein